MTKRNLGNSGIQIVPLAFGGNVFGWTIDEPTSFRLLDQFSEAGFNFIDTADMYSNWKPGNVGGESETIIGNWLKRKGNREAVVIATKLGKPMGEGKKGLSPAYIKEAVEASLKRLQTDYIDLYQAHDDDPDTPIAETLDAFSTLVKEGKVRAIGASNFTANRLEESMQVAIQNGLTPYSTLQPHYNLYARSDFEQQLLPVCERHQLAVIPYYALASGFLTGKYRSEADLGQSPRGGGVAKFLNERGYRVLDALDQLAKDKQASPAQIALAWLQHRPTIAAPIASATSPEQLKDILQSVQIELSASEMRMLEDASAA